MPFNPEERKTLEEVKRQSDIFTQNIFLVDLIESLSQILVVLNKERQIIYANKLYYDFCGIPVTQSIIGVRPGEAINCVHAFLTATVAVQQIFAKLVVLQMRFQNHKMEYRR